MKGAIRSITPDVHIDEISHDIAPGDVQAAAWALAAYAQRYPRGTVHLVVVDPGVGSARRALAAQIGGQRFVAPDNGVLTRVLATGQDRHVSEITNHELYGTDASRTFHGRDIFAPVAARLAAGLRLEDVGTRIDDPILLQLPEAWHGADTVTGEVVHVDRYGNLITNIRADWVRTHARVHIGAHVMPV